MLHIFILFLIILSSVNISEPGASEFEKGAREEIIFKTQLTPSEIPLTKTFFINIMINKNSAVNNKVDKEMLNDSSVDQMWQRKHLNPFFKVEINKINIEKKKKNNLSFKTCDENQYFTSIKYSNYKNSEPWRINKRDILHDLIKYKPTFNENEERINHVNKLDLINNIAESVCKTELNSVKTHAILEPTVAFYEYVDGEVPTKHVLPVSTYTEFPNNVSNSVHSSTISEETNIVLNTSSTMGKLNILEKLVNPSLSTQSVTIVPILHRRKEVTDKSAKPLPLYKKILGLTPTKEYYQHSMPLTLGPMGCHTLVKGNKIYPIRHKGGDQGNHYFHAKRATRTQQKENLIKWTTSLNNATLLTLNFPTTENSIHKAIGKPVTVKANVTNFIKCPVNDIKDIFSPQMNFSKF